MFHEKTKVCATHIQVRSAQSADWGVDAVPTAVKAIRGPTACYKSHLCAAGALIRFGSARYFIIVAV